jgi:hypothetical protein
MKYEGGRMKEQTIFVLHPSSFILFFPPLRSNEWFDRADNQKVSKHGVSRDVRVNEPRSGVRQ